MSDLSPCGALVAALLSITLCAFYVTHLWKFDRFRCLNFMRDRQGAFKRFMTYSYPVGVLTVAIFWVGSAVIKYKEGFVTLSNGTVLPKPFELWTPQNLGARFPLIMLNAVAWGAEAYVELALFAKELCFWFFLIHAGPSPTPWFRSIYFKIWLGGSVLAVALTFVTTIVTRADPVKNEVWQMFVGSVTGLLITIGFLPVLWVFPNFVRKVKEEGADVDAVVRLVKFHDLNARSIIRIVFRFMFVVPGVLFSIEGFNPNTHIINEGIWISDLLLAISSIGLVVQSSITLMARTTYVALSCINILPRFSSPETSNWRPHDGSMDPQLSGGE
ncbi:hypothetical protein JB92DRAFT_2695722 [Gautieria morchelliformis]|nr:hypothetical protein JB92DRAFT_2695722 [Gautieria morchelliformis]